MIPSDPSQAEGRHVDEWSVVRFDGGREDITMRLESSTAFDRAALILPVPARAELALGHDALFDDIREQTKPKVVVRKRHHLFGAGGSDDEGATATRDETAGGGVQVVDAQDLGPLRVVTLRGDDARVVGTWLSDHGFEAPEGLENIAQEYLDRHWLLVAARLRAASGEQLQKLQPLIVSFDTDEIVYPLRMSQLALPAEARVDVVADGPVALRGDWPNRDLTEPSTSGTGRLYGGPWGGGRYLSSFRFAIDHEGLGDPRFVATERHDFRQSIYRYEDVDVTGRVLAAFLGALAVLALLVVVVRRRRRAA